MGEWISIKDKLPIELHQQVLVIDAKGTMAIGVLVNKENLYFDSYCNYDITHWMPLPEPPRRLQKEVGGVMKIKFWTKKAKNTFCSHFLKENYLMELLGVTNNRKIEEQILDSELSCMIDDLGHYEDLMHKYQIKDWNTLENILKQHRGGAE